MHQLDEQAKHALLTADKTRTSITITEQLDRETWLSVSKTLTMLGGTYARGTSRFDFPFDPRPGVQATIDNGVVQSVRKTDGFVATPQALADEIVTAPYSEIRSLPKGARVLEPSAGTGQIVQAVLDANDEVELVAVEPHPGRAALIGAHDAVTVVGSTFEAYAAGALERGEVFDAVVMNPPFSVTGHAALWIDHVLLAWRLLEPGGRLVAIVPSGFEFRQDRAHKDIRQLVKDFGGFRRLPDNAFGKGGPTTTLIWLVRPAVPLNDQPAWVFRHYTDAVEPVPVSTPWVTTRAAQEAPVQVWRDAWRNQDRVLRYRAQCWRCGLLLWAFDDGDNDPRGVLGNHSAGFSLDAAEYDMVGPSVALCPCCADGDTYREALKVARELWQKPPTKRAPVSVWSRLISAGGLLAVSDAERQRYARVQAAMRFAWGLHEDAPEEELTEQQHTWRGGPDRLAAIYLTAYADRLDPNTDLDPLDRAALLWRTDPDAPAVEVAAVEPSPVSAWDDVLAEMEQLSLL
ncbi:methyltransferase [Actinoplanes sp. URMC 104]|uniref:methyltransferase n=1 Tax=Actinoplanes sp. URMC 104 TaxID=3423409 RepID=UPI003F195679